MGAKRRTPGVRRPRTGRLQLHVINNRAMYYMRHMCAAHKKKKKRGRRTADRDTNTCRYMCTIKENRRPAGKHLKNSPSATASAFSSGRVVSLDSTECPLKCPSYSGHMCLPITFINSIDGHQFKRCQRSQLALTSDCDLRLLVFPTTKNE